MGNNVKNKEILSSDGLDKKLEQLFKAVVFDEWEYSDFIKEGLPSYVKAIKQAFIDDGWVKPIMLNREESYDATKDPIYQTPKLMSSGEWYARFTTELHMGGRLAVAGIDIIEKAAKKASGIL